MSGALLRSSVLGSIVIALAALSPPAHAGGSGESRFEHLGPLRIRDLTPFGIQRLDLLPADALASEPGTWSLEVNLSYQNTYVLSDNVADYMEQKGNGGRVALTPEDAAIIFAFEEDAYLLDGELGLFDLTAHYHFSKHWNGYVTIPVLSYADGIFDEFIESFHDRFGFDTQDRELAEQDNLTVLSRLGNRRLALFDPPDDGLGDPVFAASYTLHAAPRQWNMVVEAAIKPGFRDHDFFHSSGKTDYGAQFSFQRFYRRQALYLSLSQVYFGGFDRAAIDPPPVVRRWIPTFIAAYEFRIRGRLNGILQLYGSPSTVQGTTLDELTEDKYQLSGGVQWRRKNWIHRVAVTENLRSFKNTPDVGATISVARVLLGRGVRR